MHKYAVYKPSDGDALVKSGREEIYFIRTVEALYAAVDTYLIDITWVSGMSWKNETDKTQTHTYTYTTGLTITKGSEVNNGFSLAAAYEGASVAIDDDEERVFKTTETTETGTITINLSVPPRSSLTFYQRRFRFRDSMSFVLDSWGRDWNVGSWGSNTLTKKECEVEIMSEDYVTLQAGLSGTGTINVETVGHVQVADGTRKRETCTQRCKNKLDQMRV